MRPLAAGLACALALAAAPAAQAARGDYVTRSFSEPAARGLAVAKPLDNLVAVSRARIVVPIEWRALAAKAGQVAFLTRGTAGCRYRVTFTTRSRLAPPATPTAYVAAALPSPGAAYLLDHGERAASAFRTVRRPGQVGVVRLDAVWAKVLSRRRDIAPEEQVVWSELRATATSRPGDECHSGTWRDTLGPQISDALATARASLKFLRKP